MTMPNRTFGVEIELKGLYEAAAVEALRGAGIEAEDIGYTHRRESFWKVLHDGSLNGVSCEVVSPVLTGEEGISELRKAVRALVQAGARVDRECGLHVHVGAADLRPSDVVTVVSRYAQFESMIDSWMPPSRRGNSNMYCRSMVGILPRIQNRSFTSTRDVAMALAGYDGDSSRYTKVNTQALYRHETIEFRQHSGTVNVDKIENWVRFVLHFVETSRQIAQANESNEASDSDVNEWARADLASTLERARLRHGARRNTSGTRVNSMDAKLDRVILALRGAGFPGLSVVEIARIGGWAPASVPPYLTRLRQERGCQIRKNRRTGHYRLINEGRLSSAADLSTVIAGAGFGEPEVPEIRRAARRVQTNTVASAVADTVFQGVPLDIVSFYEERAEELSGRA